MKYPPSCISLHRPAITSLFTITAHSKTVVLKVLEPKNPLEIILVLDQTPDREHHTTDIKGIGWGLPQTASLVVSRVRLEAFDLLYSCRRCTVHCLLPSHYHHTTVFLLT